MNLNKNISPAAVLYVKFNFLTENIKYLTFQQKKNSPSELRTIYVHCTLYIIIYHLKFNSELEIQSRKGIFNLKVWVFAEGFEINHSGYGILCLPF